MRLRCLAVCVGDERWHLCLVADHGSFDGSSVSVLLRELSVLYDAARSGDGLTDVLPPLSSQFADHAVWQREWLSGGGGSAALSWWEDHLGGAPQVLDLAVDMERRADRLRRAGHLPLALDAGLRGRLEGLALSCATTLYGVLLAGLGVVLSRLSRQDEVLIGSPSAGRVQSGSEDVIGFFVNTLALRVSPGLHEGIVDYVSAVGRVVRDGLEHEAAPFERVVERAGVERSLSHSPLFQVMFAWQS